MKRVYLNRKGFRKVKNRDVWIYNKEVDGIDENIEKGEIVEFVYNKEPVAVGFCNSFSKIVGRILSFSVEVDIDRLVEKRIESAIRKRKSISGSNSLRLFHSDADGISGLVVDKYGENLICSFDTAGADRLKGKIVEVLKREISPKGIFDKYSLVKEKEGLKGESRVLWGDVDDEFLVYENGFRFVARLKSGQKTGFYLDQRRNRKIISEIRAKKVLDLFAFSGGFGIASKAEFVRFVEISRSNCKLIERNAKLNNVWSYEVVEENVFDFLKHDNDLYDLVVVDPPAFAKNKNAIKGAMRAYKYLISKAIELLNENGYLAVFSCSFAVGYKELLDLCSSVSKEKNICMSVIEFFKQDIDHPYVISVPTSFYLKGILLNITEKEDFC